MALLRASDFARIKALIDATGGTTPIFADATARDAGLPAPKIGQKAYLEDSDGAGNPGEQIYTSTGWVTTTGTAAATDQTARDDAATAQAAAEAAQAAAEAKLAPNGDGSSLTGVLKPGDNLSNLSGVGAIASQDTILAAQISDPGNLPSGTGVVTVSWAASGALSTGVASNALAYAISGATLIDATSVSGADVTLPQASYPEGATQPSDAATTPWEPSPTPGAFLGTAGLVRQIGPIDGEYKHGNYAVLANPSTGVWYVELIGTRPATAGVANNVLYITAKRDAAAEDAYKNNGTDRGYFRVNTDDTIESSDLTGWAAAGVNNTVEAPQNVTFAEIANDGTTQTWRLRFSINVVVSEPTLRLAIASTNAGTPTIRFLCTWLSQTAHPATTVIPIETPAAAGALAVADTSVGGHRAELPFVLEFTAAKPSTAGCVAEIVGTTGGGAGDLVVRLETLADGLVRLWATEDGGTSSVAATLPAAVWSTSAAAEVQIIIEAAGPIGADVRLIIDRQEWTGVPLAAQPSSIDSLSLGSRGDGTNGVAPLALIGPATADGIGTYSARHWLVQTTEAPAIEGVKPSARLETYAP